MRADTDFDEDDVSDSAETMDARRPGTDGSQTRREAAADDGRMETGSRGRPDTGRIEATRSVTVRDFLIFQLKLLLDGAKDLVVFQLSIGAVLLDLLTGRGRQRRLFYRLMEWSERFDLWLNLHGPAARSGGTADGLFGASAAGSDTLLGTLELWARGGDVPRSERDDDGEEGEDRTPSGRPRAA